MLAGLFKTISQGENVQLDLIEEDALTQEGLQPYTALVVSEPNIPTEGQAAIVAWLQAGGHLLSVSGAATYDRYDRPSSVLSDVTGFVEVPRERLLVSGSQRLSPVANGTGVAGNITAFGLRGRLRSVDISQTDWLANFSDGTPAILRRNNISGGSGSATHFAYLPCVHFRQMDPYHPDPKFNSIMSDGSLAYLQQFLVKSGVEPRAHVSAEVSTARLKLNPTKSNTGVDLFSLCTLVQQVETPILVSAEGAVLTLLNWGDPPRNPVQVRVCVDFEVAQVVAVRAGSSLAFNSTPAIGVSGQQTGFWIAFDTHLDDGDMILLYMYAAGSN